MKLNGINMETNPNNHKTALWKGICIGVIITLAIVIAFYFIDKYVLRDTIHILQAPRTETSSNDTLVQIVENNHYYYGKNKKESDGNANDTLAKDTTSIAQNTDEQFQEDVFFFDNNSDETSDVYRNQVLAIRKIRAIKLANESDSAFNYHIFEVEQLSEAIKNKRSYQREGNSLRIKGLDIQNIKIIFTNNEYYIEKNGHYYAIPENMNFERLQEVYSIRN